MPAHLSRMTPARRALAALLVCATSSTSASACCLTDCLFGRQPAYAITPAVPVTPGVATTFSAADVSLAPGTTPYTAGYTPLMTAPPSSTVLPLAGTSTYAQPYAVQRPAYGAVPLNNPSVYSDLSVASGYRGALPATAYQANYGSSVQLPVTPTYVAPPQGGLARFFNSLLGTGYRTSYYTAPITYYRPATTVDPVTGTTVTVQQSCASTVEQVQRTPYTRFDGTQSYAQTAAPGTSCAVDPSTGIAPCNATSACDPTGGTFYGTSQIPSTSFSDGSSGSFNGNAGFSNGNGGVSDGYASPSGSAVGNGDRQPLAPPTLPRSSAFSGRLSYPESNTSDGYSNQSPLTGSSLGSSPTYQRQVESDLEPFAAPSLHAAKPAYSDQPSSSSAVDDAYRQGYEAGRTRTQQEAEERASANKSPYAAPEKSDDTPDGNNRGNGDTQTKQPATDSHYQLNPPGNDRPSTSGTRPRTKAEIQRDQQDLQELTTGLSNTQTSNRLVYESRESEPRVRPIPAPDGYRNPFDTTAPLKAPDLLPALPSPSPSYYRGAPRASSHSKPPRRSSVRIREASIHAFGNQIPANSSRAVSQQRIAESSPPPTRRANDWQTKVRQQSQDSGWYTTGR